MSLETSESAFFSQPRLKCLFAIPHNPKFLLSNGDFKGALAFRLGIPLGVLQRVGDGAPPLRCLDSDDLWLAVVAAFTLRPQGLDWDSLRLSRTLSRLSRLSRAVPAVPPAALRLAPPRTQGPRRARAAVPAGIRPRDHCYASQRVSKLASLPDPLASANVRSIGRRPSTAAVAERGCRARSGSALLMVQRSSSGFVYEEETYRTARQPRVRCCL